MITNFRHSTRRETIAAAALLVILSAALLTNPQTLLSQSGEQREVIIGGAQADNISITRDGMLATEARFSSGLSDGTDGATRPQPIYKVEPVYPEAAIAEGISGIVILRITPDKVDGTVAEVTMIGGNPIFEEAAIEAVSQWRYDPDTLNTIPPVFPTVIEFRADGTVYINFTSFITGSILGKLKSATGDTGGDTPDQLPVRVGGADMQGKLIHTVAPIFPEAAKAEGINGVVELDVVIDEEGSVTNIAVISGDPVLRQAAIDAVKQWRYSPTMLNGVPIPVRAEVRVTFRLF